MHNMRQQEDFEMIKVAQNEWTGRIMGGFSVLFLWGLTLHAAFQLWAPVCP